MDKEYISLNKFKKEFPQIIVWIKNDFKLKESEISKYFHFYKYADNNYCMKFYTRELIFSAHLEKKSNYMGCFLRDITRRGRDSVDGKICKNTWDNLFLDFIKQSIVMPLYMR